MLKEQEYDILRMALEAGFSLSTAYGQDTNKLMPISDSKTILRFAESVLQSKQTQEPERDGYCKACDARSLYEKEPECEPIEFGGSEPKHTKECLENPSDDCICWEKPAKKECCPDCGLEDCVHWELDKCKEKKDELAERLCGVRWEVTQDDATKRWGFTKETVERMAGEARKWHDEEKRKWAVEVVRKIRYENFKDSGARWDELERRLKSL